MAGKIGEGEPGKEFLERFPAGRVCEPEEVAGGGCEGGVVSGGGGFVVYDRD